MIAIQYAFAFAYNVGVRAAPCKNEWRTGFKRCFSRRCPAGGANAPAVPALSRGRRRGGGAGASRASRAPGRSETRLWWKSQWAFVRPGGTAQSSPVILPQVRSRVSLKRWKSKEQAIQKENRRFVHLFSLVLALCFESFVRFLHASTCFTLSSSCILFSFSVTGSSFCLLPLTVSSFFFVS